MRLPEGTELQNKVSKQVYRLGPALGRGGFGTAYRATPVNARGSSGHDVCLKLSADPDSWHGEAYFGSLLHGQSNVVRQLDAFQTEVITGGRSRTAFAITMELLESGTISDACDDGRLPWSEDQVIRRIQGLLKPLVLLHSIGVCHRDVTPSNVFLTRRSALKLGDFGISRPGLRKSGTRADVANWAYAPHPEIGFWRPSDDVYQVGLFMMTLLHGNPVTNEYGALAVNALTSRASTLRPVIKQAIGPRPRRFATAAELAAALS